MKRRDVKRLFGLTRRDAGEVRDDIREEFQFQIDMRTEDLVRSGLPEADARAQAVREFGDSESAVVACSRLDDRIESRRRISRFAGDLRQDTALGLRLLARNPWYSVAAILTLAIAIGANTAVFSIANALLFKPLPVLAPHELARVRAGQSQMSWLNYRDLAERNTVFSSLVAHRRMSAGMAATGDPVRRWGEQTSTNYFSVLGLPAALGRTYLPSDTRRDLVVLAHHVWQVQFAASPSVIGRTVVLNGRTYEISGVMPPGFRGVAAAGLLHDFWMPMDEATATVLATDRDATRFETFGRLAPGVSHLQAEAALRPIALQVRAEHPELPASFALVEVFPVDGIGAFRGLTDIVLPVLAFVTLLAVVAGLVLLIGCANIGGLLLGRAAARRKEIAVRLALGAGRGRLVRQLLTESLVLAVAGGSAGVLLAMWLTRAVNPFLSGLPVTIAFDLGIDGLVLLYALAISTAAALVFGLAPARRAARLDVVSSLKDEAAGSGVRQRLRRTLVAGQVAVCTILLVWSGLFVRSLDEITAIDPGFDPRGVLLARVELDEATHGREFGEPFFRDLERQVESIPGIEAAGLATVVPLSLENEEFDVIIDAGSNASAAGRRRRVFANRLTPGWFATLRIPMLAGRDFTPGDGNGAPPVVIVNETLARQFPGGVALGRRLRIPGTEDQVADVVGIVRDSKYWTLGEEVAPTVYLPFAQHHARWATLHARTADHRAAVQAITAYLRDRAPGVFGGVGSMDDTMSTAMVPARVGAWLTASFGLIAMALSALGVYGLVAFSVAQRTREIGVRKAIGAGPWDVVRLIVGENMMLALTGLAAGMFGGVLGAYVLRAFFAGVSPMDAITLAGSGLLVCGAALLACALPAARASLVNPLVVFRDS